MHQRIYLDNAATTPLRPEVLDVMANTLKNHYGNPSSIHNEGRTARAVIEEARKMVASCLNASIGEIFFTSGGTESNNMALKCAVRDLGVQRIISSPIEHHCVLHSLQNLQGQANVQVEYVQIDAQGHVDVAHLESLLKASEVKTMVSLMHANNEIGTMIDLEQISDLCAAHGALFHTDTVQTIGYYPIDLSALNISFLAGSAHKFNGPKGAGFVYINGENIVKPYLDGGSQERNMRAGTENIHGIVGLAKALELAVANMPKHQAHIVSLRDYMAEKLQENFADIAFLGDPKGQGQYKVLSVSFPPSPKSELLLLNLDIAGVSVSGGSACSSGADAGSHVLEFLRGSEDEAKMIRFSFGYQNTKAEVDQVIEKLKKIIPVAVPKS